MPTDTREIIIQRFQTVASSCMSGVVCYRNTLNIPEARRPCFVIFDGDEAADEGDNNPHGTAPRRIELNPDIWILASGQEETIGGTLNDMRVALLGAVLTDSTLRDLTLNNEGVRYVLAQHVLEEGRRIAGTLRISFAARYILQPNQLIA